MKKKLILSLMSMFLIPGIMFAYTITGKVVNNKKELMTGASVVLLTDSTTIANSTIVDVNGRFSLTTDLKGIVNITISMIGSLPTNITFNSKGNNIDLGNITLKESPTLLSEVNVVAQNVVEKGSNYIVFPSAKEIKSSATSLDLLEQLQYKLPGLQVNTSLNRITIENGTAT